MPTCLPKFEGHLSVLKIVATNETVEQREDLVAGMEINNAQGKFDDIQTNEIGARAEASAKLFVDEFAK